MYKIFGPIGMVLTLGIIIVLVLPYFSRVSEIFTSDSQVLRERILKEIKTATSSEETSSSTPSAEYPDVRL